VILHIVKFVLIGIDMKAFGVPSAAISNVHVTMHEHTCWKFHSNDVKSLIVSVSTPEADQGISLTQSVVTILYRYVVRSRL